MVLESKVVPLASGLAVSTRYGCMLQSECTPTSPQLVDTKSVNNTTLLHFLERIVSKYFAQMEEFLDELEKPAEAYRGLTHRSFRSIRFGLMDFSSKLARSTQGIKRVT